MTHKHEWEIDSWDVHIECNCGSVLDIGEATCRLNATEELSVLDARYVADELETRFRMADAPNALRAYAEMMDRSVAAK